MIDVAYKEGYKTGENWDNDWYPGGPFVPGRYSGHIPENCDVCRRLVDYYDSWHEGFKQGRKDFEND